MPENKKQLNDPGWDDIFIEAGRQHDIDPLLLKAMMFVETGVDKDGPSRILARSPKGALGPMQLLPSSFPDIDPHDPFDSIPAAAKYLTEGRKTYGDDVNKLLMFYHGGPNTKQWGTKTKAYPNAVLNVYQQLLPKLK